MPDRAAQARAFNAGCDARLAGRPITDNDYPSSSVAGYRLWREGYLHVQNNWGREAVGPIVPLPAVVAGEVA